MNPWLQIPLGDYEGHMASSEVAQLDALADLFAEALAIRRPESVAVLGVAGGNGLDRIDWEVTRRVVGFDINPSYLESVQARFGKRIELHCVDLSAPGALDEFEPVELVHAALVFEHAGTAECLDNAIGLAAADGALSVVLQLPGESESAAVGPSPFRSIQSLASHFALVDPSWLREALGTRGFRLAHESTRAVARGKSFWMGIFEKY